MANQYVDTGHGATVTFGTTSHAFNWTSINPGTVSKPAVATSHLGTTGAMTFIAGDLIDTGEATITFQFDSGNAVPTMSTAAETVTITFPTTSGIVTPATYAGTGLITSLQYPEFQSETIQTGTMVVKWDGATDAVFTVAAEA